MKKPKELEKLSAEVEKISAPLSNDEVVLQQMSVIGVCLATFGEMLKKENLGEPASHIMLSSYLITFSELCNEMDRRLHGKQ